MDLVIIQLNRSYILTVYLVLFCQYPIKIAVKASMPAVTLIEIGLEKYDWQLRRKYSWKKWLSKGGESSGRKVANPREGILMAIVATFVKEIYFSGWFSENSCTADSKYVPNLGPTMYLFYTTGLRSWNMAFLGVRSPNPLPKASGLGNLTRWRWVCICILYS